MTQDDIQKEIDHLIRQRVQKAAELQYIDGAIEALAAVRDTYFAGLPAEPVEVKDAN